MTIITKVLNQFIEKTKKISLKIVYGERIEGEKILLPRKFPERNLIGYEFENWCKEYNVTIMYNKNRVYFEF